MDSRTVRATPAERQTILATIESPEGLAAVCRASFRDRATVLSIAVGQPCRGASLASVLHACARLEATAA